MKDQEPVNNNNQSYDHLEPKPQSPNQIIQPEKINREGNSSQNRKEDNKKKEKSTGIKILDDDIEHPSPLLSDCEEESTEEIKKSFYENKKKESILIVERKKNLKANNILKMQQKLKAEHDSLQLKENIGKVVLNSKFMNEKNLRKNNSQNCSLLIKPETVVNNFMLERTSDINNINKYKNKGVISNNPNNKVIKKNNSLNSIQINENQKLIKHTKKNLSQNPTRQIIKIPLNLTDKNVHISNQINKNSQQQSQLIINPEQIMGSIKMNNNNKLNKNCMNKKPLKKIVKIVPVNDIKTIEIEKNKTPQATLKKVNHNYINKIQNNYNNQIRPNQRSNNNNILNKIVIRNNCNTLNKNNSRNSNKINLSFENPQNIVKMISPAKLNSIRRSNEITLVNEQNEKMKRIPLPFKLNNNNSYNMQYYTISKDKNNFSNCKNGNTSLNNDLKISSIKKVNDSYNDSEKENHPSNIKCDNCNKKTIERGGKFNNISTTYVVIKNSNTKLKYPEPSLTIDNQNFPKKKVLVPNSSTLSLQQSPMNSPFQLNSICTQNNPNQAKVIRNYKSHNYLLNIKKNKSFSYQNWNNNNYINYPAQPSNNLGMMNSNNSACYKNKLLNRIIIYKYNYIDNLWQDDSYFSYLNSSGYNY
jgi:hypothetical protein